jgi:dTDP-4-dehydrorhamnose reductase
MAMNVLVLGCSGQLGSELVKMTWPAAIRVLGLTRAELDIADRARVDATFARLEPRFVINAAAYTAVDKAESQPEDARRTNADAPRVLARACSATGAALLHVSTDYVFDGTKVGPYLETDATCPLGVYGSTKAEGEDAVRNELPEHVIVRTSWVFGEFGANFVKTILRLAKERDQLRIVADQRGRPTHAADLASALRAVVAAHAAGRASLWGTFHYAGAGDASWYEVACSIVEAQAPYTGRTPEVVPITTAEYPTPARRPHNSVLDTSKFERTFGTQPQPWRSGVGHVVRAVLGG